MLHARFVAAVIVSFTVSVDSGWCTCFVRGSQGWMHGLRAKKEV